MVDTMMMMMNYDDGISRLEVFSESGKRREGNYAISSVTASMMTLGRQCQIDVTWMS